MLSILLIILISLGLNWLWLHTFSYLLKDLGSLSLFSALSLSLSPILLSVFLSSLFRPNVLHLFCFSFTVVPNSEPNPKMPSAPRYYWGSCIQNSNTFYQFLYDSVYIFSCLSTVQVPLSTASGHPQYYLTLRNLSIICETF